MTDKAKSNSGRKIRQALSVEARQMHLEAWRRSGLSARAYAREHKLNEKNLYAWRSKHSNKSRLKALDWERRQTPAKVLPVSVQGVPQSRSDLALGFQLSGKSVRLEGFASQGELVSMLKKLNKEVFNV